MAVSATSPCCVRCGRLDFPHACKPIAGLATVAVMAFQGRILYDVTEGLDEDEA